MQDFSGIKFEGSGGEGQFLMPCQLPIRRGVLGSLEEWGSVFGDHCGIRNIKGEERLCLDHHFMRLLKLRRVCLVFDWPFLLDYSKSYVVFGS